VRVEASDNGAIPVMKDGGTVETGNVTGDAYPSKKTAAAESEETIYGGELSQKQSYSKTPSAMNRIIPAIIKIKSYSSRTCSHIQGWKYPI
jgi:hypothetical protein